jgi:transglutaminase-like putative cysteine protease
MKMNFKSFLQTTIFVLIFGFIGYYALPALFNHSEPYTSTSIASMTTAIPENETASLPTSVPVLNTSSTVIVTTPSATIVSTPLKPNIDSTELISQEYKFEYDNFEWTWDIQIPKSLYDYYKALPRSQTKNYSVYVTHPLADEYIQALSDKISQAASENNYDSFQTISLAAAFVQSLPYTSDLVSTGYDEYPRYPIETLVDNGGDCEDTAILAAALIRHLGYDTVLIIFSGTPQSPGQGH